MVPGRHRNTYAVILDANPHECSTENGGCGDTALLRLISLSESDGFFNITFGKGETTQWFYQT